MSKFKLKQKHGMILLLIMILSSMFTAFMYKPVSNGKASIIIKFNDYEVYNVPVSTNDNTTMIEAISYNYYVTIDNGSIKCIRSECEGPEGTWLAFTDKGVLIDPVNDKVKNGDKLYLIYNSTTTSNVEKDQQAIKDLLKLS